MKAKIGIVFLSISLLVSSVLASNQAFGGDECIQCEIDRNICLAAVGTANGQDCLDEFQRCLDQNQCRVVGGIFEGVDTTSLLLTGAQMNAAWMIPVIVAGIGFAIVIARKF